MATLLLADDSLTVGRAVETAFALEDIRVETVVSGERAIAQLEADPPDVILADICMARVDGYDIASYVQRSPELSHIPVILLAGPFERVNESRARSGGCAGIILKPLQPKLLVSLVRAVLAGERPPLLWPSDLSRGSWQEPVAPKHAHEAIVAPPAEQGKKAFDWLAWRAAQPSAAFTREPLDAGLDQLEEAFEREETGSSIAKPDSYANSAFVRDVRELNEWTRAATPAPRPTAVPATAFVAPVPVQPAPVTVEAAPKYLKVRLKLGGSEFQAEGPADLVQAQLEDFKRLAGAAPRNNDVRSVGAPPGTSTPEFSIVLPRRRSTRKTVR